MRALSLSILLLLGLAACGNSEVEVQSGGSFTEATVAPNVDLGLLERIMRAPSTTEFSGQRKARFNSYDKSGGVEELTYTESVASDGRGSFTVVVEDLLAPALSPARVDLFKMVQKGRSEFFYNHRDFRVRDLDLIVSNYRLTLEETRSMILGRDCLRLLVRENGQRQIRYEVDIDHRTGLVLEQREFDSQGRLASEVSYFELVIGPLTPQQSADLRHRGRGDWRSAVPSDGLADLAVQAPSYPPAGFQLLEQRIVTDPLGDAWYELIYGDGIEQMFMLYALDHDSSQSVQADNEVAFYRHGRWTVVDGLLNGERVIALGKVSSDDLLLALQSTL